MAFSLLLEKRALVAAGQIPESAMTMLRDEFGDEVASWSLDDSDVEAMYDGMTRLLAVGTPFTPWLATFLHKAQDPRSVPLMLALLDQRDRSQDDALTGLGMQLVGSLGVYLPDPHVQRKLRELSGAELEVAREARRLIRMG
jgi:hypothetical protein